MRKQGLFTMAFMLMLPFTAFADATVSPPPNVTMEASSGGSAGRVIGGPKVMYDGATAENGIRINWPYVNHNGVNVCQIGQVGVGAVAIGCANGPSCSYGGTGTRRVYTLAPEGVHLKRCGSSNIYAWES